MTNILDAILDPFTLVLMLGGMLTLALLQNGAAALGNAMRALGPLVTAKPDRDRDAARAAMLQVDHLAQLRGIACTDRLCTDTVRRAHPFLAEAVRKFSHCERIEQFEMWATQTLADRAERHRSVHNVWYSLADSAPALGMAGTIIGLIGMFAAMDDPARIGPAMALALLTTLYGVVLANLIAAPVAARLISLSQREHAWQQALCERMLAVARRENAPVRRAAMREVA
ncbi:MotA/TolQ/ExbB proton channel family protein [Sphingobium algorifonticola]|uniref:Flagellar motor protein n=1 Tax=Sphingobium algorifonticola TaxID=2008318 RepID=A0A437JBS4_9SPHN|nr:MotA/TolQ/ExbB proton channel family protein [Sphingobium algorifonticola]RVT43349.1 flagellar motor protein [Sphingobium algorifonticola]